MRVEVKWHEDMWQEIKNNAMFTIHKDSGKYPDSKWKSDILLSEHSPIRSGRLIINCYDVPSFVIGHVVLMLNTYIRLLVFWNFAFKNILAQKVDFFFVVYFYAV